MAWHHINIHLFFFHSCSSAYWYVYHHHQQYTHHHNHDRHPLFSKRLSYLDHKSHHIFLRFAIVWHDDSICFPALKSIPLPPPLSFCWLQSSSSTKMKGRRSSNRNGENVYIFIFCFGARSNS